MQLFISDNYTIQENNIQLSDERIVHQCFHVLRMKANHEILLQDTSGLQRYTITIQEINKKVIIGQIITIKSHNKVSTLTTTICMSLPNRIDKAELIVQKSAELGIDSIIFFPSARSIIRELSDKKRERLSSIAIEATEQSFGRSVLTISFTQGLDTLLQTTDIDKNLHILLDHNGSSTKEIKKNQYTNIYAYIGPEGGFTNEERNNILSQSGAQSICLGDSNLRMETAAIITGWLIKNIL